MVGSMAKIEPAITTLLYQIPSGVSYIDIARDLSRCNRRLYRQGRVYAIESITVMANGVGMRASDVLISNWQSMGNSYMVHEAWEKAFTEWKAHLAEYSTAAQRGKWNDFKIYLDDSMEDGTINDVYASDGAAVSAGEWEYSKFAWDDDGTEQILKMHMIGSSNLNDTNYESGIALIEEWADQRPGTQESPPIPGSWSNTIYAKLKGTDELTDLVVENIETDNDQAPYHADDYYGGATNGDSAQVERIIGVTPSEFTRTVPGFIAPCGLIRVQTEELSLTNTTETATDIGDPAATGVASPGPLSVYQSGSSTTSIAVIRLVPGPYKGVLAPPMGQ